MALTKMELVLSAEEILRDAIQRDYESVIVFGFKDGNIFTRASAREDVLRLIGALEIAKRELWDTAEPAE